MNNKRFTPPSDTFCVLPWIHLSTRPDGAMRVCCTANASSVGVTNDKEYGGQVGVLRTESGIPANLNNSDLESSWNNSYMRGTRQMMLKGQRPPSCMKCYKEEDAGHHSKRQWETNYWSKRINIDEMLSETEDDGSIPTKIRYIDLRMGTKCQLACVMCSPHDSSGWVKEWNKMYPQLKDKELKEIWNWENKGKNFNASYNWHKSNDQFWEQFWKQIPNMLQLYSAGGESTVMSEHYTILEKIIESGHAPNLELRYNSNAVEWREDLFDLWSHFKLVRFHYSLDSIGAMNDYIRYPSNWNHQVRQIWKLNNETTDNVEVTLACAVNALNMYYLPDFFKWKLQQGFTKVNMWPFSAGSVNTHFVYWPAPLNVKTLPVWFKKQIEVKYEKFYQWWEENWELGIPSWYRGKVTKDDFMNASHGIERMRGMINFMNSEDWSRRMPQFREYIRLIDKTRNLDFCKTFPEMAVLMDDEPSIISIDQFNNKAQKHESSIMERLINGQRV